MVARTAAEDASFVIGAFYSIAVVQRKLLQTSVANTQQELPSAQEAAAALVLALLIEHCLSAFGLASLLRRGLQVGDRLIALDLKIAFVFAMLGAMAAPLLAAGAL